jgi:hypothetical protein
MNPRVALAVGMVAAGLSALPALYGAGPESPPAAAIPAIHGYGAVTTGAHAHPSGREPDVCMVTSLEDSGRGTLRKCLEGGGPREIRFAVGGTIVLEAKSPTIVIREPYLTINGFSAPAPGITITKNVECFNALRIGATHDIVIAGLRFKGLWKPGDPFPNPRCRDVNNTSTLGVDGDTSPLGERGGKGRGHKGRGGSGDGHGDNPRGVQRLVLAYNTFANGHDSNPDYWGDVVDATHQSNLVIESWHPSTISYKQTSPRRFPRRRMSWYANVYARNGERQPQLANGVHEFDMRDNVIYGWTQAGGGGYGLRFKGVSGDLPTSPVNVIHNAFIAAGSDPDRACVFGDTPAREEGPDKRIAAMKIFFEGNLFPEGRRFAANCATTNGANGAPFPVPERAQLPPLDFGEVVRRVGMPHRTPEEQALLDEIAKALGGADRQAPGRRAPAR